MGRPPVRPLGGRGPGALPILNTVAGGADEVFAALADPTRRLLLDRLAAGGEQNATQLGVDLPMSRQAVAKHLTALEAANLVTARRLGREVRYALVPSGMAEATAWMENVGARWDARLDALRKHLER